MHPQHPMKPFAIPTDWTAEQAMAVIDLLDELREREQRADQRGDREQLVEPRGQVERDVERRGRQRVAALARGVQVGAFHLLFKMLPLGRCDLKGAAVFVFLLEALWNAVVGIGLQAAHAHRALTGSRAQIALHMTQRERQQRRRGRAAGER